jgi:hypothetical protein
MILTFFGISHNYFCIGKVMDWVYGSRNHDWLFVHGGLATMGRRGRSGSQEFVVIAWKERERERGGCLGCHQWRHLEMTTRQHSIEVADGALMGRWFWARGGEIGAGVSVKDNEGVLVMTQRRAAWRSGRPKVATGVWRSKMTKGNWVGRSNKRLGQIADWADKKIWLRV